LGATAFVATSSIVKYYKQEIRRTQLTPRTTSIFGCLPSRLLGQNAFCQAPSLSPLSLLIYKTVSTCFCALRMNLDLSYRVCILPRRSLARDRRPASSGARYFLTWTRSY